MKIVLIGPMHPYRGGIAHFLETMHAGLKARGHETEGITFTRQYPEMLFPGKTQLATDAGTETVEARRLIDTLNPISWVTAAREIGRLQPDVILFKYWMPFFAPAFGTIARRLKKQGTVVEVVVDNAIPHERRPGDLVLGRYFLRSADGCIVMSETVQNDLARLGVSPRIERVNHPVYDHFGDPVSKEEARRALDLEETNPLVLFFGFVRKYKGLDILIRSMEQVRQRLPEAVLLVAGEFYDDKESYTALIDRLGLENVVRLDDDYIAEGDVGRYFCAADVVVQPYVSATQSGVAQIAFHFDKPLIVTDVGNLAQTVPHEVAGLVVPPNDPSSLADAIIRFFAEDMADRLAAGIRLEKPKYSWDRLYEAVEALAGQSESKSPLK